MLWHQGPFRSFGSANVTGSRQVPTPPARWWMQGWAMAPPGGELSTYP